MELKQKQVLITIWILGNPEYLRLEAYRLNITKSILFRVYRRICGAIANNLSGQFPVNLRSTYLFEIEHRWAKWLISDPSPKGTRRISDLMIRLQITQISDPMNPSPEWIWSITDLKMDLLEKNVTDQKSWSGFSQRNALLNCHSRFHLSLHHPLIIYLFLMQLDVIIYCFVFLFVSLVVVLCCLRCCYCLAFFLFVCFVLFFVFNSKTILKFHSLFYVSWNDSRDRIVVSTLRCGRNNPGSNPGHGTHKTVSFFSISFFFLSFYFHPSKCSILFLIFFLIVSSFSFGAFEECWYFVPKWYEIQWLLKITTACRVCDLTMSI